MNENAEDLARRSLKARKLRDAALILPFLGIFLFLTPIPAIFKDPSADSGIPAIFMYISQMISSNVVILVAITYVAVLFGVAALADRQVEKGHFGWLKSPMVYTLSLSVYCTGWTFYFIGWFWLLRKLVRVGQTQRITSIADLVSSRYGKSATLAVIVTILTVISSTPYIALQLQSLTISYVSLTGTEASPTQNTAAISFWFAVGLAGFTILFGTRNVDVNERHHGVVTAIALEAIVKLACSRPWRS